MFFSPKGGGGTAEIRDAGGKADFYPLNVRDTSACNEIVATVEKQYGAFDSVIANAGIAHKVPLDDLTNEKWDHTMDIDLKGVFRIVLAALPGMKKKGTGNIVAVSSIMGVAYGWDELVRGPAVETGRHGIRVNGLAPGFIRTAQAPSEQHSLGAAGLDQVASSIPLGRVGDPDDMADVITFLVSDKARYLTEQTITVDGGLVTQSH